MSQHFRLSLWKVHLFCCADCKDGLRQGGRVGRVQRLIAQCLIQISS
jgi:hypothetical protein